MVDPDKMLLIYPFAVSRHLIVAILYIESQINEYSPELCQVLNYQHNVKKSWFYEHNMEIKPDLRC